MNVTYIGQKTPKTPRSNGSNSRKGRVTIKAYGQVLLTAPPTEEDHKFIALIKLRAQQLRGEKP
jgi:hypothetical protein